MAEFLIVAAGFVLAMVALGLARILRGPGDADRMMAAQLLGTGASRRFCCWQPAPTSGGRGCRPDHWRCSPLLSLSRSSTTSLARMRPSAVRRTADTMQVLFDIFTVLAVSAGAVFFLAGTVGLLRFPDSLSRLHALTKADNLGLGLVVLGLLPQAGGPLVALKLVAVWLLAQLAGAIVTQLIARTVRRENQQA
jgi:multicomponent Na+:H+ antiporter subunit G